MPFSYVDVHKKTCVYYSMKGMPELNVSEEFAARSSSCEVARKHSYFYNLFAITFFSC